MPPSPPTPRQRLRAGWVAAKGDPVQGDKNENGDEDSLVALCRRVHTNICIHALLSTLLLNLQFNSTQCLALACARFSRLCARRRAREILGQATHTVKFAPHLSVVCVERVRVAVHLEASFDMLRLQVFR